MTNKVRWNVFADADVDSFNVYRAITGITVGFPNSLVVGDKLVFAAASSQMQTVTLGAAVPTIDTVLADINAQAQGLKATKSGTNLYVRCTARDNPKLKLYACSFLTNTSQAVRIVVAKLEWVTIAPVPFVIGQVAYEYDDVAGDPLDWYHITSVKTGVESVPSQDQQALIVPEDFCVIEGRVVDLQNNPIANAEVKASVMVPVGMTSNAGIAKRCKSVVTDELGRWNLPILQGQQILFQIPVVGYNQVILVPAQDFILFKDLKPVDDYNFDGVAGQL